jgi:hypothetical protein
MFLGLGADIREIAGNVSDSTIDDITVAATMAFGRNITDQSMLSGVNDFIGALQKAGSQGNIEPLHRYLNGQIAGALPFSSLANTVRKEDDPLAREVWGMLDTIKNKLPGYSKDLKPSLNLFGEEVHNPEGLGPDVLSPIRTSKSDTDPLASEIARLNIDLKKPAKTLMASPGAPGIDLTADQYYKLSKMAGESFKGNLKTVLESPEYKALPESSSDYQDGKEITIKRLHTQSQMNAVKRLISEDPALQAKWIGTKQNASNAISGKPILPL